MKLFKLYLVLSLFLLFACKSDIENNSNVISDYNYLTDFPKFTVDSLINIVVEIPAGSNQKWEVNKQTGYLEWERINKDSLRIVNYLPYPANYGFIPNTISDKNTGGDGDPLDVFVLGERVERGKIIESKIIGLIKMKDNDEIDDKFIAVPSKGLFSKISSIKELNDNYPGIIEILTIWLKNYKNSLKVEIIDVIEKENISKF